MNKKASASRIARAFSIRSAFLEDWDPSKEENPNGLRDLIGSSTPPLMRDPSEGYTHLRAALPGDDPSKTAYDYHENPYSVMMPRQLRALLNDSNLSSDERKRVTEAFLNLKSWEDGSLA